ncbi:hypothetical protein F2P79_011600 [Pimephales promelas]|nr:hypothetical protein F2P79_011600 [Pimephales promelas]
MRTGSHHSLLLNRGERISGIRPEVKVEWGRRDEKCDPIIDTIVFGLTVFSITLSDRMTFLKVSHPACQRSSWSRRRTDRIPDHPVEGRDSWQNPGHRERESWSRSWEHQNKDRAVSLYRWRVLHRVNPVAHPDRLSPAMLHYSTVCGSPLPWLSAGLTSSSNSTLTCRLNRFQSASTANSRSLVVLQAGKEN